MVQRNLALVLLSALAIALVLAVFASSKVDWRNRHVHREGLICHVGRTLMSLDSGDKEESLECDVLSSAHNQILKDMSIGIDLSPDFVDKHRKSLDTGLLYIHIPGGSVIEEYIEGFGTVGTNVHIPAGSDIAILDSTEVGSMWHQRRRHRRTAEQTRGLEGVGTRTVLVFRVTTDDASPDIGATEFEERMFSPTAFSFASQFDKCSFGQLTFEPHDIGTPVTELYVPGETSSFTERTILNAATRRAAEAFGSDIWDRVDHAIFCMPDGTGGKPYIAYSGVGSFFSVYHNVRCAYPTTVMHEIAHNCGLGHAFENGEEYGDETTIMGFSSSSKTGPSKCFNGQNIAHFQWFSDRTLMVDPFQGHQLIELAPFVDYDLTNSYQAVLITISDMHIVYNRAKGFNAETSEYQNKVTVAQEENDINSALLAVLDMDQSTYTVENFLESGKTLYVQVCESVVGEWEADYYTISIGLDYSMCARPTPNPTTSEPSPWPTPEPTQWPTSRPTHSPSWSPTTPPTTSAYLPTYTPTPEFPSQSPSSKLPELILVPLDQPTLSEITDDLIIEETTRMPKKPEEESDRPVITVSSFVPTMAPTILLDEGKAEAITADNISADLGEGPHTRTAVIVASFLALFVSCCGCVCIRWNQRRLDEQKRNLRLLQYNASSQVKIYMQNPV